MVFKYDILYIDEKMFGFFLKKEGKSKLMSNNILEGYFLKAQKKKIQKANLGKYILNLSREIKRG